MRINRRLVILSMILSFVLSLIAASSSTACTPPPELPGSVTWAPSVTVGVVVTSPLSNSVTVAANNWNQTFAAAGICYNPYLILSASAASSGPAITFSYKTIPPVCTTTNGVTTCKNTRGITHTESDTTAFGFLKTISIDINSLITAPAAMTEVAAHEIGHTFGLNDCNGCALNSTVMESNPTLPAGSTINTLIATPGPTGCDLQAVLLRSPGYNCSIPTSSCPSPYGAPPGGCSNAVWDTVNCTWTCSGSPIIIDISGQGFSLTNAANGVQFDISGTGHPLQMGWTAPGADNAFLALPASDGLVHSGRQLFGNFTPQPPSATPNGFAALAVYDDPKNGGNGDGVIDAKDKIFSQLRLWVDANHNGISEPEELHTLPELGVESISLNYHEDKRADEFGNVFRYRSKINPDDPDISHVGRIAYDVFFTVIQTTNSSVVAKKCAVPTRIPDVKEIGLK
jgi:hypothetical protein